MKAAQYVEQCSKIPSCRLHVPLIHPVWVRALSRANDFDYKKGDILGLYPYKWGQNENKVLLYFYDRMRGGDVGFFVYDINKEMIHIGIVKADMKTVVEDVERLFGLNKIFRTWLLGVKVAHSVEVWDSLNTAEDME